MGNQGDGGALPGVLLTPATDRWSFSFRPGSSVPLNLDAGDSHNTVKTGVKFEDWPLLFRSCARPSNDQAIAALTGRRTCACYRYPCLSGGGCATRKTRQICRCDFTTFSLARMLIGEQGDA